MFEPLINGEIYLWSDLIYFSYQISFCVEKWLLFVLLSLLIRIQQHVPVFGIVLDIVSVSATQFWCCNLCVLITSALEWQWTLFGFICSRRRFDKKLKRVAAISLKWFRFQCPNTSYFDWNSSNKLDFHSLLQRKQIFLTLPLPFASVLLFSSSAELIKALHATDQSWKQRRKRKIKSLIKKIET